MFFWLKHKHFLSSAKTIKMGYALNSVVWRKLMYITESDTDT